MNYPKITLKAARINAGYTQVKAAEKLGVSKDTLRSYEQGKTVPQWGMVHKICSLYEYPIDYIFFGS